jgi:hypothetical protein
MWPRAARRPWLGLSSFADGARGKSLASSLRKQFFFEKKNQKTFFYKGLGLRGFGGSAYGLGYGGDDVIDGDRPWHGVEL